MSAWFEGLHIVERVFFFIALPSTLIMVIQTVMLFFGMDGESSGIGTDNEISGLEDHGDGGMSGSEDSDSGESAGAGLRFITTRGVVAFLTVAGWTGITCMSMGLPPIFASLIAAACGAGAMVGIAHLVRWLMGLSSIGKVDYRSALGVIGEVYLRIPGDGGIGKVTLTVSGAHRECDAMSENGESIGTGRMIRVTDIIKDSVLVVEAVDEGSSAAAVDVRIKTGREN